MFLKLEFCKKLDILKIELYIYKVKLDISNIEFHLNFQKKKSVKICKELDITTVKFHL